jgi:hypothetical protein
MGKVFGAAVKLGALAQASRCEPNVTHAAIVFAFLNDDQPLPLQRAQQAADIGGI